jgi:hypothetical protein
MLKMIHRIYSRNPLCVLWIASVFVTGISTAGCSLETEYNRDHRVLLTKKLYPNAKPYYGMRNIFFSETKDVPARYPTKWQDVSLAPIIQHDGLKTIYAARYRDDSGEFRFVVDRNADLNFQDEAELQFSLFEDILIADVEIEIHHSNKLPADDLKVDYQLLRIEQYFYARVREYWEGTLVLKDEPYQITLRPRSIKFPILGVTSNTICSIDINQDRQMNESWKIEKDGRLIASELIDITGPFLVGETRLRAVSLEESGQFLNLRSTDEIEGTAVGFRGPDFAAVDIDGMERNLSFADHNLLLLEFWSIHCPWSEIVRPGINALMEKHPNLSVLSLSKEKDSEEIREFMTAYDSKSLILLRNDSAWHTYNPTIATPMFYLFDRTGTILIKGRGASMLPIIEKILIAAE